MPTTTAKRYALLIMLSMMLGCSGSACGVRLETSSSLTLRVMTFNIENSEDPAPPKDTWMNRKSVAMDAIREAAPDLLSLEEILPDMLDDMSELLASFDCHYASDAAIVLCARRDRFELLSDFREELIGRSRVASSWNRVLHSVTVKHKITGAAVEFYGTHLDGDLEEVQKIAEFLKPQYGATKIVTGDFNSFVGSNPYNSNPGQLWPLTESGDLDDTFARLHPGFLGTTGCGWAPVCPNPPPYDLRIDWVLASFDLRPLEAHIPHVTKQGVNASDHDPVIVTFDADLHPL